MSGHFLSLALRPAWFRWFSGCTSDPVCRLDSDEITVVGLAPASVLPSYPADWTGRIEVIPAFRAFHTQDLSQVAGPTVKWPPLLPTLLPSLPSL